MNAQTRKAHLFARLFALGFTPEEAVTLRRIEMTLQRWAEHECNGDIQRDDNTGKPFRVTTLGRDAFRAQSPIADREAGALKRLAAIMAKHPALWSYHQGDPRGCALYVGKREDMRPTGNPIVDKATAYGMTNLVKHAGKEKPGGGFAAPSYTSTQLPRRTFDCPEQAARAFLKLKGATIPDREMLPLDGYYTRGLAVCD